MGVNVFIVSGLWAIWAVFVGADWRGFGGFEPEVVEKSHGLATVAPGCWRVAGTEGSCAVGAPLLLPDAVESGRQLFLRRKQSWGERGGNFS